MRKRRSTPLDDPTKFFLTPLDYFIAMSLSGFIMPIFKNQDIRWENKMNPLEISNCE